MRSYTGYKDQQSQEEKEVDESSKSKAPKQTQTQQEAPIPCQLNVKTENFTTHKHIRLTSRVVLQEDSVIKIKNPLRKQ